MRPGAGVTGRAGTGGMGATMAGLLGSGPSTAVFSAWGKRLQTACVYSLI
jgi:hypothetical protein